MTSEEPRPWRRRLSIVRERWLGPPAGAVLPSRRVASKIEPDEQVLYETGRHWLLTVPWWIEMLGGGLVTLAWFGASPSNAAAVPFLAFVAVLSHAAYRLSLVTTDRVAVTDSQVLRVWGVASRKTPSMPISRVLDLTVDEPLWLRPLRCGHLTIETAAQEQGLREIRYVPHPDRFRRAIHAARQASGRSPQQPPPGRPRVPDHPRSRRPLPARDPSAG